MSPRDDDLAKLAGLCGWRLDVYERLFGGFPPGVRFLIPRTAPESSGVYSLPIPAPDAPLPEAMAFVGRLCAELPGMDLSERLTWCAGVLSDAADIPPGDVVWSAVRSAIRSSK